MRTSGWRDNYVVRAARQICTCYLILLSMCSFAQVVSPESFVGRSFWYEPSHDKYVQTEFYNSPSANASKTRISRKTQIRVVNARKNWFAIRFEPVVGTVSYVYIPIGNFKSRLYQRGGASDPYSANAAFMRASLFEDDPDVLKSQFETKDPEKTQGLTPNPSAKLKPWQKYKENWGNVTPAPKKNKHLLLDDIKQPEQPDTTP
jgi:hypothetical protein